MFAVWGAGKGQAHSNRTQAVGGWYGNACTGAGVDGHRNSTAGEGCQSPQQYEGVANEIETPT